MSNKPNIILITIDSLRADHLGFMGYRKDISPFIDKLAEESAIFLKAFANGPNTPYSFPSILTSTYPLDYQGPKKMEEPRRLIGQVLREQGYTTAAFHSNPRLSAFFGYNQGWDFFEDITPPSEMRVTEGGRGIRPSRRSRLRNFIRPFEKISHSLFPEIFFRIRYLIYKTSGSRENIKVKASFINQIIKDFICSVGGSDKPFFVWIHYMDVHGPYLSYLNYTEDKPLNFSETLAKSFPSFLRSPLFQKTAKRFIAKYLPCTINLYDEGIKYVDGEIGKLLVFLKKEDIYQNSLIVLTSDHGDEFLEHGGASHDNKLYNELLHVPLLMKIPGSGNRVIKRPVSLIDLAPTICDFAQVSPVSAFKGKNLFNGDSDAIVFHQTAAEEGMFPNDLEIGSIDDCALACQTDDWKYIIDYRRKREELYDLVQDPREQRNIAPLKPDILFSFQQQIEEFKKENPPLSLL